jgi:two-component system, NtrC family, response regulator HydG
MDLLGPPTILIVDDDHSNVESLSRVFQRENHEVLTAENGQQALDIVRRQRVHIVLTDLMMPGMNGVDLLRSVKAIAPESDVILMTAYGTVETAVQAMKEGAYDFVTKPFKRVEIVKCVRRALEKQTLVIENRALREELGRVRKERRIIGNSPAIRRTFEMLEQVAPSSATVLLLGDSGTGKELFARALHDMSPRANRPFVAVNCAALPESILESELFGYEEGAFTGARRRKEGRFELAHSGTLFLDEIAEMSPTTQVKLLRVLQEGEFERLGGTRVVRVDVRIVAATNRALREAVQAGRFREDLFYRLDVIAITLPPLAERREDIPLLAQHFLQRYAAKNGKTIRGIAREAMDRMLDYPWPGNVRELENTIERAVVLVRSDVVSVEDLPESIRGSTQSRRSLTVSLGTPLEEIERLLIHETLRLTRGDKRLAAQLLGTSTRTIYRKLEQEAQREAVEGEKDD